MVSHDPTMLSHKVLSALIGVCQVTEMAVSELPGNPSAVWTVKKNSSGEPKGVASFPSGACWAGLVNQEEENNCSQGSLVLWCILGDIGCRLGDIG